jgi:hypothetical protein
MLVAFFNSAGMDPFGVATADFQGDGLSDLVVANTFSDTVSVLLNTSHAAAAAATTTTLNTTVTSPVFGQTQTLTATVTSTAGTPTGPVIFFDGTTRVGQASLNAAGQATLTVSLGVGPHSLTATFGGNQTFATSTSAPVAETASRANTVLALSASINPVGQGRPVTFTASVTAVAPSSATPTGIVTFFQGNTVLGTVGLDANGKANLTTTFSTLGSLPIKAVFNGFGNFAGSSQTITEQVSATASPAATTTALVASANPVRVGQTVTFTATVSGPAGKGTPTGTILFFVGNTAVATVTLDATGKARLTGHFSVSGKFTIRAVYSGDSNFAASSQSLVEQVV